jgi:pimeloyl-ACP methyl ester carboxylesterase
MLRAGLRWRRGLPADLSRPPRNGPDGGIRPAAQRRRRPRHAARLRPRGDRGDCAPPHRSLGWRLLRAGDGREGAGAGRWSRAGVSAAAGLREVPEHRIVVGSGEIGDDEFRSYFVVQSPEMLERYERHVRPAAALVDQAALERIGERWELARDQGPPYAGPTLVVAGRLDSTVGYAAAADLVDHYPHASLAVVDDAGHALPHEQPGLLRALVAEWLTRVERRMDGP